MLIKLIREADKDQLFSQLLSSLTVVLELEQVRAAQGQAKHGVAVTGRGSGLVHVCNPEWSPPPPPGNVRRARRVGGF